MRGAGPVARDRGAVEGVAVRVDGAPSTHTYTHTRGARGLRNPHSRAYLALRLRERLAVRLRVRLPLRLRVALRLRLRLALRLAVGAAAGLADGGGA